MKKKKEEYFTALCILLVLLNIGDLWSTYLILNIGGFELNPFARWIFDTSSLLSGGILWKIAVVVITLCLVFKCKKKDMTLALITLAIIVGMLAATVFSNIMAYWHMTHI